jgi:dTDP-4-dehydrorhamnose 3,5-epimerase
MKIFKEEIDGLLSFLPDIYEDSRGYFYEQYNQQKYKDMGVNLSFVQDNISYSNKHTLRGLHFQVNHPQGKLVQVLDGKVFDVAVDIRKDSPTFGKWVGKILSQENKMQFYIPPGFAHGFFVMSDSAVFLYKCTDFYSPKDDRGILWSDLDLKIQWPISRGTVVSDKDLNLPQFKDINLDEKIF